MTYDEVIVSSIRSEMERDDSIIILGTRPPPTLVKQFGSVRVRKTPIAEEALTGMAVGAALSGLRPILDYVNVTFSFVAFDQIANQAARMRFMFGGQRAIPVVFRASYFNGTRAAAQHSQTGYALYAHLGGIRVVVPSSAAEAGGLMMTAIRDDNPVFFFEPGGVAAQPFDSTEPIAPIPLGRANTVRSGTDVTVVAIGHMVAEALLAATALEDEGVSVEVIDPRTLVPFDVATVRDSVRRTGRLLVVDESYPTASFASEIIALVVEDRATFSAMTAPASRLCTRPIPVPYSSRLEDEMLPRANGIAQIIRSLVGEADA